MGLIFSQGNIGGAISGQIYRAEWAPRYVQGHAINVACYVIALAAGSALWYSYTRDNAARDRAAGEDSAGAREKGHVDMSGEDLGDLGDR